MALSSGFLGIEEDPVVEDLLFEADEGFPGCCCCEEACEPCLGLDTLPRAFISLSSRPKDSAKAVHAKVLDIRVALDALRALDPDNTEAPLPAEGVVAAADDATSVQSQAASTASTASSTRAASSNASQPVVALIVDYSRSGCANCCTLQVFFFSLCLLQLLIWRQFALLICPLFYFLN